MRADGYLERVGEGTGFFYRIAHRHLLITCWHVLTGRNPDEPTKAIYQQPDTVTLYLPRRDNPKHFAPGAPIPLYEASRPVWYEPKPEGGRIDIAALPIDGLDDCHIVAVNDHAPYHDVAFEPGKEVSIIGYPFGLQDNPFAIWKRATMATEPRFKTLGKEQILLDTPGRPGMSGSPVYFSAPGFSVSKDVRDAIKGNDVNKSLNAWGEVSPLDLADATVTLEFCGLYAGSYGDQDLDKLNLGRLIPLGALRKFLGQPQPGTNAAYQPPLNVPSANTPLFEDATD